MLTPVESKVTRYEAGEAAPTTKANDRRKKGNQLAELMPPGTVDSGHEKSGPSWRALRNRAGPDSQEPALLGFKHVAFECAVTVTVAARRTRPRRS